MPEAQQGAKRSLNQVTPKRFAMLDRIEDEGSLYGIRGLIFAAEPRATTVDDCSRSVNSMGRNDYDLES